MTTQNNQTTVPVEKTIASLGLVGVLCGGPSHEREISLKSGTAVHEALSSLDIRTELVTLSSDPEKIPDEIRLSGIRCAFIALHGPFGEDGTVQSILEELKIPYTGSDVEASRYAMDKISARRRWIAAKLPVPYVVEAEPISALTRAKDMVFPIVVKPAGQGSSIGMSIVDTMEELAPAAEKAGQFGERIILEEYLPGPEVTVGILEDRPLPVVQVIPKNRFYDYEAKYTPGMTEYRVPAPISKEETASVQEIALKAHEVLGCRSFSRVDFILVPGRGPVILEINTIPGMTESSLLPKAAKAAGIGFPELCRRMLASALL
ncbi:MAG: D-alanine--D-alanine ligase [Candidatus Omnitrophica bacterium]|nr:D-alanine--D-alanine ligase [Candidatus Omnitrophota bacterium]